MAIRNDARIRKLFVKKSYSCYKMLAEKGPLNFQRDFFRAQVVIKIGEPCPYCGNKLQVSNFTADHAVPVALGGASHWENIVVCCKTCNKAKGNLLGADFLRFTTFLRAEMPEHLSYILGQMARGTSFRLGAQRRRAIAQKVGALA